MEVLANLTEAFREIGTEVKLTSSSEWFRQTFASSGDWSSWVYNTVCGRDYMTRKPSFNGFVLYTTNGIGRITADITRLALANNSLVMAFDDRELTKVSAIYCIDENSWTHGWGVVTDKIVDDKENTP
jgi:hypothetical protein